MPVLVSRSSQRLFSTARMRAIFRCCRGAPPSPYQPSLETLTKHLRAVLGELSHLVGKDRLVTDKYAGLGVADIQRLARLPAREGSNLPGQPAGEAEQLLERHVLAEGYQMDLVVAFRPGARRRNHRRRVVDVGTAVRIAGMLNANRAGNDVRIGRARDVGQRAAQMQVGGPERRRRFGPHDQPRRIRSFALADARSASAATPASAPDSRATSRLRGWECSTAPALRHAPSADAAGCTSLPACKTRADTSDAVSSSFAARIGHEKRRRHGGIHQRDLERKSVDPGHGRDARQRNVVDLRGAQQVPGEAGDVGARQFHGDPERTE